MRVFFKMLANVQQFAAALFMLGLLARHFLSAQKVIESTARSAPRPPSKNKGGGKL
jgi:hypothetical protein